MRFLETHLSVKAAAPQTTGTTARQGEENPTSTCYINGRPEEENVQSTMAYGEEENIGSTMAYGEEEPATVKGIGIEESRPSTQGVGEEVIPSTAAYGEEAGGPYTPITEPGAVEDSLVPNNVVPGINIGIQPQGPGVIVNPGVPVNPGQLVPGVQIDQGGVQFGIPIPSQSPVPAWNGFRRWKKK